MKTKNQFNGANDAIQKGAALNTLKVVHQGTPHYRGGGQDNRRVLNLSVAASEPDLQKTVQAAFDLAKSGGRELNLAFNHPSNSETAHLVTSEMGY